MSVPGISWSGVLIRVALAVALVFVTYNPIGHSFYHWLTAPDSGSTAVKALLGVILLIGWAIRLRKEDSSLRRTTATGRLAPFTRRTLRDPEQSI